MNRQELRLGNYINHSDFKVPMMVSGIILEDKRCYVTSIGGDSTFMIGGSWDPIPLTEEWLLKFGFEQVGFNYYLNGFKIFFDSDSYFYGLRDEGIMDKHLEYLHQLQNLYFALTNEELKLI
jgi:hypothetical protein